MEYVVAQVNIGRLVAPLDSPELADFMAGLDPVNAAADGAPGFVWRLQSEDGNATALRGFEQDGAGSGGGIIINMSVWETVEALAAFRVRDDAHRGATAPPRVVRADEGRLRRAVVDPARARPDHPEAEDRVKHLRAHGPTPCAFTLKAYFPPPGGDAEPLHSPDDWVCPV